MVVSLDDVETLKKFQRAQEAPYRFLSDVDASVAAKYEVLEQGKPWAKRVTFLVDPEGVVRQVDRAVKVDSHGADLVAALKTLQE